MQKFKVFDDKVVLITGGTGSFGKIMLERILQHSAVKKVIVFSRDEMKQEALMQRVTDERVRFCLGDIRDKERLLLAFSNVDFVVHAAALKIVHLAEYNPTEYILTNIIGSKNVLEAAIRCGVEKVVSLSTDKASSPLNLYGGTKFISDKLFTLGNSYSGAGGTKFSVVRYGNVMGSRGSVIPLFLKRREEGVIPITDVRMTRFMITLDQSVDVVVNAFNDMTGGEIFVKKIPSMKVVEIAKAIAPEAKQKIVGVRPGEKIHEQMISSDETAFVIDKGDHYLIVSDYYAENSGFKPSKLPENFSYNSKDNDDWMSISELRSWVEKNGGWLSEQ